MKFGSVLPLAFSFLGKVIFVTISEDFLLVFLDVPYIYCRYGDADISSVLLIIFYNK